MRTRRQKEIIAGQVDSAGTIVRSEGDFSVVRNSAGNYTLTFPTNFRVISVVASGASNGFPAGALVSGSNAAIVVAYNSNSQVATDIGFNFIAVGYI